MEQERKLLSIIIPCRDEEKGLADFRRELMSVVYPLTRNYRLDYEIIFVDDGSQDGTSRMVTRMRKQDPCIHLLRLARNFGKEAAMLAGFKEAAGDYICVMDADLQDPPELLEEMYAAVSCGRYDAAAARRNSREHEPAVRSWFAAKFYRLMERISTVEMQDGERDYRLMSRAYLNAVLSVSETNRFSKGIFAWVGFRVKWIDYAWTPRKAGGSRWSFANLFWYALDGVFGFSESPARFPAYLSVVFAILFMLCAGTALASATHDLSAALAAAQAALTLLCGAVTLLSLSVVGQYAARSYTESRDRPLYIVMEKDGRPYTHAARKKYR